MKDDPTLVDYEIILPSQFVSTSRRQAASMRGEHQLLIAMLEDAVHCFQKNVHPRNKIQRQLFTEAEQWIMLPQRRLLHRPANEPVGFSFENVCEALGLDADYLRAGLRRWREARRRVDSRTEYAG